MLLEETRSVRVKRAAGQVASLRISLFGSGRALIGETALVFRGHPKMWPLLAYIALRRGSPIVRDEVASALWPDVTDLAARANLRRHIGYLCEALDTPGGESWIRRSPTHLELNSARSIWIDTEAFLTSSGDAATLADAKAFYAGELLAGCDDEWIVEDRERFRHRYADVLDRLVALERRRQNRPAALVHALDALRIDPFREGVVRDVMRLKFADGDRTGALHAYERFSTLIRDELQAQPAPETVRLALALRAEEPATAPDRRLPAEPSSFVGRVRELTELQRLANEARLVTIAGAPGVGKTRLALHYARCHEHRYADGARFVDLSAATGADAVERCVDEAVETRARARETPTVSLAERLRNKQLLIILDNCEQVVAACAALAARLIRHAPGVTILATSRIALRVNGEATFALAPLERNEAERLFIERARFARRDVSEEALRGPALESIVVATDGLPLALELCAARLRSLSIKEVVARLSEPFASVDAGDDAGAGQIRTLRASLETSYALLSGEERTVFRRFAVFAGGATAESVRWVAAPAQSEPAVFAALLRLAEHSLLVAPHVDAAEQRFVMLRSVADFARLKLEVDDAADDVTAAHARYYSTQYIALNDDLRGPRAHAFFEQVARDHGDLRAALRFLIAERHDPEAGGRLALALSRFWFDRGHVREGADWLEAADTTAVLSAELRPLVLHALATLIRNLGNYERAFELFGEALEMLRGAGDARALGKALATYANAARVIGKSELAFASAREALAVFEPVNDPYLCGYALLTGACIAFSDGDLPKARTLFRNALDRYREAGADADIALALGNLGAVALYEGDLSGAAILCRESSERARSVGNVYYQASADLSLARIAFLTGDRAGARAVLDATLTLAQTIGDTELLIACIELHATLCAAADPLRAATLLGCADASRGANRIPRSVPERDDDLRLREAVGASVPSADVRAAAEAGRALSIAEALLRAGLP